MQFIFQVNCMLKYQYNNELKPTQVNATLIYERVDITFVVLLKSGFLSGIRCESFNSIGSAEELTHTYT